ncbi:hypothetical protein OIDMADRAFT_19243 [Oidiodendron maius Zn]|uniref:Uncharacterized protein n=1 Tax=Oidiodendron maius (strain Zn) TaxID=913774 RepID=A0A0C3GZG5_OIDMZ|nr:hypothetical protein OIDMADRAFT_19243 [Oidiodendron maius Zn]
MVIIVDVWDNRLISFCKLKHFCVSPLHNSLQVIDYLAELRLGKLDKRTVIMPPPIKL